MSHPIPVSQLTVVQSFGEGIVKYRLVPGVVRRCLLLGHFAPLPINLGDPLELGLDVSLDALSGLATRLVRRVPAEACLPYPVGHQGGSPSNDKASG
jgi:hypothetical protein